MSTPRDSESQDIEIAHVLMMDVVEYSQLPIDEQRKTVEELKQIVSATPEYRKAMETNTLIVLDSGDGMALVFFGGPESPARCAIEIAQALRRGASFQLRMGVNSGPVYRTSDIKGNNKVTGSGINFAQRVMDAADSGQILLSSSTAEILNQNSEWARDIEDLGIADVKHDIKVHFYNLVKGDLGNPEIPTKLRGQLKLPSQDPSSLPERSSASTGSLATGTPYAKRLLRAIPVFLVLLVLAWIFGHTGVVHQVDRMASDAELRLNSPPSETPVAIVNIDDEDYRSLFASTSPLDPRTLQNLISAIAKGEPAVIGVDIDTSSSRFANEFTSENWDPRMVWERELKEVPEQVTGHDALETLPILGGHKDVDPAKNSAGLPLLIDDAEDKVTRRYRRLIPTKDGVLPSFAWAVSKAYLQDKPADLTKLPESSDELLIRYSGNREGSHRLRLSASKVEELSQNWPAASPIRGKIVLLGGSYLSQDKHDTPIGELNGVEVLANVIETELSGGGYRVPSRAVLFLLELFEAFLLILIFHTLSLRSALAISVLLIPIVACLCSRFAYGDMHHFFQFTFVLLGLLIFELYEHFRRKAVLRVYDDILGSSHS
jgi:CHASE2 domain-containing sensor protein/class 3 adenylate cyclase